MATVLSPPPRPHRDSWDDDDDAAAMASSSPTRLGEMLGFLAQVERVHVRETQRLIGEPSFSLDVYLADADGELGDEPTYRLQRSLADFAQLRDRAVDYTSRGAPAAAPCCAFCANFQIRLALREGGDGALTRSLSHLFGTLKPLEAPFQSLVNDMLELARAQDASVPCVALQQVPALVTRFLVERDDGDAA